MKTFTQVQKITLAALLLALAIVFTIVAKLFTVAPFPYLRISLTPAIVVFSSFLLGPFYGVVVGIGGDLIPAFLYSTGSYNFLLTIVYALLGVLPWCLSKITRRFHYFFSKPWPFLSGLSLFLISLACFFFATNLLDEGFGEHAFTIKIIVFAVTLLIESLATIGIFIFEKKERKKEQVNVRRASVYEIGFIAFIVEMLLMVIMKSLAFYLFFYINDLAITLSYWYLFSTLLMGSGVDILLMVVVSLVCFGLIRSKNNFDSGDNISN